MWNLSLSRAVQLRDTGISVTNLAGSLTTQAEDTIELADYVLSRVVQRLEADGTSPTALAGLDRTLVDRVADQNRFSNINVFAADGRIIASSQPAPRREQLDRGYFRHHQLDADRGAFIGPPVRGHVTGRWMITVSRRFNAADGHFAGVVVAWIEQVVFYRPLSKLRPGSGKLYFADQYRRDPAGANADGRSASWRGSLPRRSIRQDARRDQRQLSKQLNCRRCGADQWLP